MNFISREQVLAVFERFPDADARRAVEQLPFFPAPNPEMKDGRNALGQTEAEFWNVVEDQDANSVLKQRVM